MRADLPGSVPDDLNFDGDHGSSSADGRLLTSRIGQVGRAEDPSLDPASSMKAPMPGLRKAIKSLNTILKRDSLSSSSQSVCLATSTSTPRSQYH